MRAFEDFHSSLCCAARRLAAFPSFPGYSPQSVLLRSSADATASVAPPVRHFDSRTMSPRFTLRLPQLVDDRAVVACHSHQVSVSDLQSEQRITSSRFRGRDVAPAEFRQAPELSPPDPLPELHMPVPKYPDLPRALHSELAPVRVGTSPLCTRLQESRACIAWSGPSWLSTISGFSSEYRSTVQIQPPQPSEDAPHTNLEPVAPLEGNSVRIQLIPRTFRFVMPFPTVPNRVHRH